MFFFKPAFAATLLASVALAAPAPAPAPAAPVKEKISFKIARPGVKRHRDGKAELERAYRKFGIQMIGRNPIDDSQDETAMNEDAVPAGSGNAAGRGGNGTVGGQVGEAGAIPKQNVAFFVTPVTVGGQNFTMDLDTGSADLWLFSTKLSQQEIGGHSAFNPNKSSTFKALPGGKFNVKYGDGSRAAGIVGTETVNLGGASVTNQKIGVATFVSKSFQQDTANDGLMGLSFSNLNTITTNGKKTPQNTFYFQLIDQLKTPVFTADLEADNTGTYEFGAIDPAKFKGNLATVPVNPKNGFWQFESKFTTIDGKKVVSKKPSPAIADTGTTLMLVDNDVAVNFYKKVPGAKFSKRAGGFIYPCNTKVPDFGVDIGGQHTAVIPGNEITFVRIGQQCFGGVQSNGGVGIQIYGDTMFKTQFVVFDGQNNQLQIAPKSNRK